MRPIWKGYITFGLITVPVALGVAQQRRDVSFRTLSRTSLQPVRQKRWDEQRDCEVSAEETVKGYEHTKGRFLVVEDSELERFAASRDKTIRVDRFVPLGEVDPVLFERAYWVAPDERAERPYALLLRALEQTAMAALGRFVLSTREYPVLLRPYAGALTLETLHYAEDVRLTDQRSIADAIDAIEIPAQELALAVQLIGALTGPFSPAELVNETRVALVSYLEAKVAGETPALEEAAPEPAPVIDLAAALAASLKAAAPASSDAAAASA